MNIFKCAIPGSKHSSSIFASCGIGNYGGPWWPMLVPLSNEEDHKLYFFFLLHQNHGLASQLTPSVCSLWPIMVTMQFVHKYPFAYRLCPGHKFHHFIPTSNFTSAYFWTSPGTGKCKSPVHYKMILRHPWNEERSSSVAPSAAAESRRSLRQYFFFFFWSLILSCMKTSWSVSKCDRKKPCSNCAARNVAWKCAYISSPI